MSALDVGQDGPAARDAVPVARGVGDRDQLDPRQRREDPGVVAAHHAEAEQAGAQSS